MSKPAHSRAWRAAMLALLLGACDAAFEGEYRDELGVSHYAFASDGRVRISAMGASFDGEYELDGDRVVVRGPNGTLVFHRQDDRLEGPMGLVLYPAETMKNSGGQK